MSESEDVHRVDVLVVGAGAAGLIAALEAAAAGKQVTLLSFALPDGSSSHRAQGGIASAFEDDDSPALHADDTMRVGRGLCRPSAVEVLVREGPGWIEKLAWLGVPFGAEGSMEGGHQRRRVHQVGGAETGRAVVSVLLQVVRDHVGISFITGERVLALWTLRGRCIGVRTNRRMIAARATVLATGGYAALWERTTNPPGSQGDGLLLAYAAGAELADLEFVQFHPTALEGSGLLLSEALRGDGALLLDDRGVRFVDELAPRDEVARAIYARGRAYLDLRAIERDRFPAIMQAIHLAGFDPSRETIPVAPAAHYTMGGISTRLDGATTLESLYAAGECACTGVHGANRLASNSLLECVVFGARAGRAAAASPELPAHLPRERPEVATEESSMAIRDAMWRYAGVVRDPEGLRRLEAVPHTLARLVGEAALARTESRGSHFRIDKPDEDPKLARHLVFAKDRPSRWSAWR